MSRPRECRGRAHALLEPPRSLEGDRKGQHSIRIDDQGGSQPQPGLKPPAGFSRSCVNAAGQWTGSPGQPGIGPLRHPRDSADLLIRRIALMLNHGMNEASLRSGLKLCPICNARIPFSLALHMMAAHSPQSEERNARVVAGTMADDQDSTHRELSPSGSNKSKHRHRKKAEFFRRNRTRTH